MRRVNTNRPSTPCKCNKINCQKRKSLAKHPDEYPNPPKCPMKNCDGMLKPDSHRIKARTDAAAYRTSIGELCRCGGLHRAADIFRGGRDGNSPHRKYSNGCVHYRGVIDG